MDEHFFSFQDYRNSIKAAIPGGGKSYRKRYIMLLYIIELFAPVALIYPYTLPIKYLLLLIGGIIFILNMTEIKSFAVRKETRFLFLSIVFLGLSCVINIQHAGLRSIYLWASNIVLFFIIYVTVLDMKIDELKRFMDTLGSVTICITFLFSAISLVLLIVRFTGEYGTGNGILKRMLSSMGMFRPSDRYGVCSPYFYGITNHSLSIGLESFMSLVMSLYKSVRANKGKLFFYWVNICLQFLMIIAAGMRNLALLLIVTLVGIAPFIAIKYLLNKYTRFIAFLVACFTVIVLFACIGGERICKGFVEKFLSLERDYEIEGTYENDILEGKKPQKTSDYDTSLSNLSTEEMVAEKIEKSDILTKLDVLSSGRIKIWLTALKKLTLSTKSFVLGYGINEVAIYMNQINNVKKFGLHSEFMSELYVQGVLGVIPNMLFYIGIIVCILKKLFGLNKENSYTYEAIIIAGTIMATAVASCLGIMLTYSVSIYPIFIWILMGYISNKDIHGK